jgi:hypothetical protein
MRILKGTDMLKNMKEKFDPALFIETLKINNIPITAHWAKEQELEEACHTYIAQTLKWNPDTTLLYYNPPYISDKKDLIDVVMNLPYSIQENILCLFIADMTSERFIDLLDKTIKMKVFL